MSKIAFWSGSDLENRAVHIPPYQEFLGVFTTHSSIVLIRSFVLIFPYLEQISTDFTNVVRSPCFIPSLQSMFHTDRRSNGVKTESWSSSPSRFLFTSVFPFLFAFCFKLLSYLRFLFLFAFSTFLFVLPFCLCCAFLFAFLFKIFVLSAFSFLSVFESSGPNTYLKLDYSGYYKNLIQ